MTSKAGHTFTAGPAKVNMLGSPRVLATDEKGDWPICDIRGWGHLTGKGHGALGLPHDQAAAIQEANAHLIAEAFNVAHETGLTPRELAERCAKLEAFAQAVIEAGQEGHMMPTWMARDARAAIAKAEGGAK